MILSEYAKRPAGRRADRDSSPSAETEPQSVAARAVTALEPEPDGTGTWLVAGLVELRDEVNAAGRWRKVTGTDVTAPQGDKPGRVVLHFDGRSEPMGYLTLVYARDTQAVNI